MNKIEIKLLKKELESYNYYRQLAVEYSEELEELYYQLGGLKGVNFEEKSSTTNQEAIDKNKWHIREKIDEFEKKLSKVSDRVQDIDQKLNKLPFDIRQPLIDIYANGQTYVKVAKRLNMPVKKLFEKLSNF